MPGCRIQKQKFDIQNSTHPIDELPVAELGRWWCSVQINDFSWLFEMTKTPKLNAWFYWSMFEIDEVNSKMVWHIFFKREPMKYYTIQMVH